MSVALRFRIRDKALFDDIRDGHKTIDTRADTIRYRNVKPGDTATLMCGKERLAKTIARVYRWPNPDAMAQEIDYKKVVPRAKTLEEAISIYDSFPGYAERIREHGLLGFELI